MSDHPFFRGLEPAQLVPFLGCGEDVTFPAGRYVFREGETADTFYALRFGSVSLEVRAPGRGPLTVDKLNAGDVLGWSWLFPPYRWHYDARATGLVRATAFRGECLRREFEANPRLGYLLMTRLAEVIVNRLQATRLRVLDLYAKPSS